MRKTLTIGFMIACGGACGLFFCIGNSSKSGNALIKANIEALVQSPEDGIKKYIRVKTLDECQSIVYNEDGLTTNEEGVMHKCVESDGPSASFICFERCVSLEPKF